MNYRIKLYDILHRAEIDAVKKFTAVPNAAVDNLTVGELRELRAFLSHSNASVTGNDALDALAIIVKRFNDQSHV